VKADLRNPRGVLSAGSSGVRRADRPLDEVSSCRAEAPGTAVDKTAAPWRPIAHRIDIVEAKRPSDREN
jgi:hypothetical protein